ncbi:MAG: hypothetical protein LBK74_07195 [Treponema sp.]|nr:hypothetical protein [Treponema sp.]
MIEMVLLRQSKVHIPADIGIGSAKNTIVSTTGKIKIKDEMGAVILLFLMILYLFLAGLNESPRPEG